MSGESKERHAAPALPRAAYVDTHEGGAAAASHRFFSGTWYTIGRDPDGSDLDGSDPDGSRPLAVRRARPGRRRARAAAHELRCGNDPSAGSPTETLLRLHLPLNDEV